MSGIWDLDKQSIKQKIESSGHVTQLPQSRLLADERENKKKSYIKVRQTYLVNTGPTLQSHPLPLPITPLIIGSLRYLSYF